MNDAPAPARPAASLLVLRRAPTPQVLMGLRGAGHRFMPNRLVFPGGAVDPEDHAAEPASAVAGHVARLLELGTEAALARALPVAAARELEEETGLTLGRPPHLAGIDYLCRAITPETSPVRFDARFLIVADSAVSGTLAGSGELEDLRWYGVEEALALDLAHVTSEVLRQFQSWLATPPEALPARRFVPVMRGMRWGET